MMFSWEQAGWRMGGRWGIVLALVLSGCGMVANLGRQSQRMQGRFQRDCPQQPGSLNQANVTSLDLQPGSQQISNTTRARDRVGYELSLQAGDRLRYRSLQELCLWLVAADGRVMNENQPAETGRYVLQVGSREPLQMFELDIELLRDVEVTAVGRVAEPEPAPRATLRIPSPQPAQPAPPRDPLATFNEYFQHLQSGSTASAWALLSPEAQQFWGGFDNYDIFWDTISQVNVSNPRVVGESPQGSWIEADIEYLRPSGTRLENPDNRFYFVWDPNLGAWEVAISPRQFIIEYFRAINEEDYDWAWNALDPSFRRSTYEEFLTFWKSMDRVEIGTTELLSYLRDRAFFRVDLAFFSGNGSRSDESLNYQVQFFPDDGSWRFVPFDAR